MKIVKSFSLYTLTFLLLLGSNFTSAKTSLNIVKNVSNFTNTDELLKDSSLFPQGFLPTNVGNGGDVIICNNENGSPSYELLDFFEIIALYDEFDRLKLGEENQANDINSLAITLIERVSIYSPELRSELLNELKQFDSLVVYLKNFTLTDVDDSRHIAVPIDCIVEQIAIQREARFPGEPVYYINKNLWDQLDLINKAGLVVHEILYRVVLRKDILRFFANSLDVRLLVGLGGVDAVKEKFTLDSFLLFYVNNLYVPCESPLIDRDKKKFLCNR